MMLNQALTSSPGCFRMKRCRNVCKGVWWYITGLKRKCRMNKSLQKQMFFYQYVKSINHSLKKKNTKECLKCNFFFLHLFLQIIVVDQWNFHFSFSLLWLVFLAAGVTVHVCVCVLVCVCVHQAAECSGVTVMGELHVMKSGLEGTGTSG